MNKRKGLLVGVLLLASLNTPVNADESADEIVAMMSWWEEYGLYWDDMGVNSSLTETDEDAAFAWLDNLIAEPEGSAQ